MEYFKRRQKKTVVPALSLQFYSTNADEGSEDVSGELDEGLGDRKFAFSDRRR